MWNYLFTFSCQHGEVVPRGAQVGQQERYLKELIHFKIIHYFLNINI